VNLICGFHVERGKACSDTARTQDSQGVPGVVARGRVSSGDPVRDGVPMRSMSADRFVVVTKPLLGAVRVERRGRVIRGSFVRSTGEELGGA
jgi:hypothetical protein